MQPAPTIPYGRHQGLTVEEAIEKIQAEITDAQAAWWDNDAWIPEDPQPTPYGGEAESILVEIIKDTNNTNRVRKIASSICWSITEGFFKDKL